MRTALAVQQGPYPKAVRPALWSGGSAVQLIEDLKQRKIVQWALAYLAGAWVLLQVLDMASDSYQLSGLVMRLAFTLAIIGFPVTLVLAWYHGERGAQKISGVELLILALLFAIGGGLLWRTGNSASEAAGAPAVSVIAPAAVPDKSIAVLPFVNMSADKDNEYFSDGISEEILNALVKVADLKVAGRTSSFYFKGKNESLITIGEKLGVANVLEGSVRKQGDKVRITAQLIRTKDGFHLWSETYDGDLKDIFALQEKIAQTITGKLQVILQGNQKTGLVKAGTSNTEAYSLYLQATAIFNRRDGARFAAAIDMLKKAIELDPKYARAHSRLAALHTVNANYASGSAFSNALPQIELHARRATELDQTLAEPYAALSTAYGARRRFLESDQASSRALQLDPDDVTANFWHATQLIETGYMREGTAALDRTLALDPLLPNALLWRARMYVFDGDLDNAERLLRLAAEVGHVFVGIGQTRLDIARGNKAAAIHSMTQGLAGYFTSGFPPDAAALFSKAIYGDAEAKKKTLTMIDAYLDSKPAYVAGVVPYVLIRSGNVGMGLKLAQDKPTTNDAMVMSEMFRKNSEVKGAPEFPEFARRSGLAALWDAKGPPDYCRKNDSGDYVCE